MYSASVLEIAVLFCFFEDQLTSLSPKNSYCSLEAFDELHVTWAHLEKKQTRLQTNTKTLEDLCSQSLETASQAIHDAVITHQVMASHISRRRQPAPTQTQI
ncbi:hypothetical protein Tco_0285775 [Tanacetum coccineum]